MTKEELKKEAIQYAVDYPTSYGKGYKHKDLRIAYLAGAEPREKRIAELEEKISVLLSCKNCPENKGGYICKKEYENKCLTQKIQFIKELQEEIADLEAQIEEMKCCENCRWEQPCSFCDDCKRNRGQIFPETSDNWSLRRNLNE